MSLPKARPRSRVTEVLCTPGEQHLRTSQSAVPPEQQRLVFGPSSPAVAPCGDQDPVFEELRATQAIVFQDSRALGRLVKPRVLVDLHPELATGSLVSLIYDYWQPASVDRKHGQVQHLRIPLDSRYCSTSVFSLSAILTGPGGPVALPSHEWSGSKTAAAVNQHQQRLDYIRTQQRLFTEGEGKDSPNRHLLARSDAEYTIDTGPEWETSSLSLTFNTAAELPWLQRIILKLLVVPKAPVDDNGGPIGDTRAEVTVSNYRVGASGLVDMASASAQPVPQGHSGRQQTGGSAVKQSADDTLPQAQRTHQEDASTPSCAAAGCGSDAEVGSIGVLATADGAQKPEAGSSPSAVALANSGGAAGSCRRGAVQPTRSAGGGGGEPHGGIDSEDEGAARGQSGSNQGRGTGGSGAGGGTGNGGDREDPGRDRERGQEPASASPKSGRKQKEKRESELGDAAAAGANGLEPPPQQQPALTASSSPAVPSSSHSHSDRDAAASLQEASSRSTTMDTVDASSDAADEPHVGVAESKPTVKLIPNGGGPACGAERGAAHGAADQLVVGNLSALAPQGKPSCGGAGGGDGAESERVGIAAAAAAAVAVTDARGCTSGCCGRGSASGADAVSESSLGAPCSPPAAGPDSVSGQSVAVAKDDIRREGSGASGLPTRRRKSDDAAPAARSTAASGVSSAEEARDSAEQPSAASGITAVGGAVDGSCSGTQPSSSPPAFVGAAPALLAQPQPPLQAQQQQQRPYPNGATLQQQHPHAKGATPQGIDVQQLLQQQQQQHALGVSGASHMPHLPHAPPHHGAHGHLIQQNGKLRNGELLSDPALLAQQLLPALAAFAPGQGGSGSGTPAVAAAAPAVAGQSHAYANGVDAALLQQLLLAQSNGALQLQHAGIPLHGQQHMQPAVTMYNLLLQQQAQQQQAQVQSQVQQQQQAQLMQMFQPQYQQHAVQQAQQQQLFLQGLVHAQGLAQAEAQYTVPAAAGDPAAFYSPPPMTLQPVATQAAMEASALPAGDVSALQQQQPSQGPAPVNAQPLNPAPIVAPTPQMQAAGAQSGDSAGGQAVWDSGSASSVRSEPSTAVAAPLTERPMGPQHRVQSQGNMLAAAQGGGAGGSGPLRDGGGGRISGYRGRTSYSGQGGPGPGGPGGGGGGASSSGAAGQSSAMTQGGSAYGGPRPYGGPGGGSRHGGGGHGYGRGGRYDGGSADSSRPSSRGPHPHGGGGHMRQPHPADPIPPPEALPLPDHPKGSCDLDRFISQIEPVIAIDPAKPPQQALQELRLRDLWNFYFEPSLYGREVFTLGGHRGASNSYFVPYLSAIQIFTRALPTDVGGTNRLYVSEDNQGWPKHMHLKFEYFEQELPFNRLPLYDQIELLSSTTAASAPATSAAGRPAAGGGGAGSGGGTAPVASRPAPAAPAVAPAAAGKEVPVPAEAPSTPAVDGGPAAAAASVAETTATAAAAAAEADRPGEAKASTPGAGGASNAGGEEAAAAEAPTPSNCAQAAEGAGAMEGVAAEGGQAAGGAGAVAPTAAAPAAASAAGQAAQSGSPLADAPAPAPSDVPDAAPAAANTGAGTGLLYDMRLLDVHPASWFAVAWYPVYRIPDAPLYARFLTFHSFAPLVESMRNVHERLAMGQVAPYYLLSLPVVGLNWYNMQGERWMEPLEDARPHTGSALPPPVAASAPAVNSPRGPHNRGGGGGRVPSTDVWYQHLLQNYQSTADRLARGLGLKVLGQHGAEEVRLRVPDYEFFRARS